MINKGFLALVILFVSFSFADELKLRTEVPARYTVKKGDTLWDIASTYLQSPWQWQQIWHLNPGLQNPHLIYPGDILAIIDVDGEKKLTVVERAPVKIKAEQKLVPTIRTQAFTEAIPSIPTEKIKVFLSQSRIESAETLNQAPYIIAGSGKRIISGANDIIYARGTFQKEQNGFGIYRPAKVFEHPKTGEFLGVQAISIGSVQVTETHGDVKTLIVEQAREEVRINDRLLTDLDYQQDINFFPKKPKAEINAEIIAVEGGVTQVGLLNVVVLSAGTREQLEPGDVLQIEQKGEVVKDQITKELIQLPNTQAGLLIVFRSFEKMAYGLVVMANKPLIVGDIVKTPE